MSTGTRCKLICFLSLFFMISKKQSTYFECLWYVQTRKLKSNQLIKHTCWFFPRTPFFSIFTHVQTIATGLLQSQRDILSSFLSLSLSLSHSTIKLLGPLTLWDAQFSQKSGPDVIIWNERRIAQSHKRGERKQEYEGTKLLFRQFLKK